MKKHLIAAFAAALGCLVALAGVQAADPAGGDAREVTVQLGTASGDLVISPGNLTFEKGKLYKLVFKNPSDVEHRLAVRSLASSVRTFGKPAIDLGRVQGGLNFKRGRVPFGYLPQEFDVAPGGVAEWLFVPYEQTSAKIGCTIKSHAEAGMFIAVEVI